MDEVTDGNVWEIRVPRDRLAVLIGKNGDTKRELEDKAEIALEIDSREGDVTVIQKGDPLKAALSISVIQAIARGFSLLLQFSLGVTVLSYKNCKPVPGDPYFPNISISNIIHAADLISL